jgi:hypothetical protein
MEKDTKKCQYCSEEIMVDAKKCKHCGEWLEETKKKEPKKDYKRSISVGRFTLLALATLGIYDLYWMYKQWVFLKEEKKQDISPFWRAFFSSLFSGVLASEIKTFLKEKNIIVTYSPVVIGISFFILSILYKLPDPYWLVSLFAFVAILPMVIGMNHYYEEKDKHLEKRPFIWWEIVLICLGLIVFCFAIYGTFYPDENTTDTYTPAKLSKEVSELNKKIDRDNTEDPHIVKYESSGMNLRYYFQYNDVGSQYDFSGARERLVAGACKNDDVKAMLSQGVILEYIFTDSEDEKVVNEVITNNDCKV